MQQQANKLVRAIGSTIALLTNLDDLIPLLEELGLRHVYYNVRPKHFKYLKVAWFNMLKNALAIEWTDDLSTAWNKVWKYMTSIMKSALEDAWLLCTPPDPEKVKIKILINHIDKIETQNMSFWADIWYAAFTNENENDDIQKMIENRKIVIRETFNEYIIYKNLNIGYIYKHMQRNSEEKKMDLFSFSVCFSVCNVLCYFFQIYVYVFVCVFILK